MEAHAGVCVYLSVCLCVRVGCGVCVCVEGGCDRWGFEVGVGLREGGGKRRGNLGENRWYGDEKTGWKCDQTQKIRERQAQLNSQERSRHYAVGRCIGDVKLPIHTRG